jgi:hypothetical protein
VAKKAPALPQCSKAIGRIFWSDQDISQKNTAMKNVGRRISRSTFPPLRGRRITDQFTCCGPDSGFPGNTAIPALGEVGAWSTTP